MITKKNSSIRFWNSKIEKLLDTVEFSEVCREKGEYLDNCAMENSFGLMKQKPCYGHTYHNFAELKQGYRQFIKYYRAME